MDSVKHILPFGFLSLYLEPLYKKAVRITAGQQPHVPRKEVCQEMSQAGSQHILWGFLFIQQTVHEGLPGWAVERSKRRHTDSQPWFSIRNRQPTFCWKRLGLGNWLEMKKVAGVRS